MSEQVENIKGVVTKIVQDRAYGFLHRCDRPLNDRTADAFFHLDDVLTGAMPAEGMVVYYNQVEGRDGKARARRVSVLTKASARG